MCLIQNKKIEKKNLTWMLTQTHTHIHTQTRQLDKEMEIKTTSISEIEILCVQMRVIGICILSL